MLFYYKSSLQPLPLKRRRPCSRPCRLLRRQKIKNREKVQRKASKTLVEQKKKLNLNYSATMKQRQCSTIAAAARVVG